MASCFEKGESKTKVLLADEDGGNSCFYEFFPPGAINDIVDVPVNPCNSDIKNDADAEIVFDIQRQRMKLEHLRKLLLQVSTLVKFGVQRMHFVPQENVPQVQSAIDLAKKELVKDDDTLLKQLIAEQATLSGRHDNMIENETNFSLAKATILELIENSERDIIEELEFGDSDFLPSTDDGTENASVDLLQLQKSINVLIDKKTVQIMSMETGNGNEGSNEGGGGGSGDDSDNSLDIFMSYL